MLPVISSDRPLSKALTLSAVFAKCVSLSLLLALAGCARLEFPWVYKVSVQQGNILDQEDIDKLELGMTKRQVQFVLGSPLLVDTFAQNEWHYYYSRRDGKGAETLKTLTIYFENDRYARHAGTESPNAAPKDKTPEEAPAPDEVPAPLI
jgi:outer membrane protein assembly factor BamE